MRHSRHVQRRSGSLRASPWPSCAHVWLGARQCPVRANIAHGRCEPCSGTRVFRSQSLRDDAPALTADAWVGARRCPCRCEHTSGSCQPSSGFVRDDLWVASFPVKNVTQPVPDVPTVTSQKRHPLAPSPATTRTMITEMRKTLARLPYAEKLRRMAELIEFSRRFKAVKSTGKTTRTLSR